jgi:predicted RNA-binding Zn-ribbon protein involved in translation (DUF1610 family)
MTVLWESEPVARVHHICTSCGRTINPGEKYRRVRVIGDDTGDPFTHKGCEHCRAFVDLYIDEFSPDPHEGWTDDDVHEWEPDTPEAAEHKRRWSIGWRHGRDLYPVPGTEDQR